MQYSWASQAVETPLIRPPFRRLSVSPRETGQLRAGGESEATESYPPNPRIDPGQPPGGARLVGPSHSTGTDLRVDLGGVAGEGLTAATDAATLPLTQQGGLPNLPSRLCRGSLNLLCVAAGLV